MRAIGRKTGLASVGAVVLLGTFGFVQTQGGWTEVLKVPAKRDGSTPTIQNGYELLGIARVTEDERAPRLVIDDLSLGGVAGLIGSTRIWFRLPIARAGEPSVPKDDDLKATLTFPNGERYAARWEMADISQRIATLMIPAGHAPADWIDVQVEDASAKAKWRLVGIPKTPMALRVDAKPSFEAEGLKVTARARRLARPPLNMDVLSPQAAGGLIDLEVEGPALGTEEGRGVRVRFSRFVPEYRHPVDAKESGLEILLAPGLLPKQTIPLAFPYADSLKRVGVYGWVEVLETTRTPLAFDHGKWTWPRANPRVRMRFRADEIRMPDGGSAYVTGLFDGKAPRLTGNMTATTTNPDITLIELKTEPERQGWEKEVARLANEAPKAGTYDLGTVTGTVLERKVVRTIPFRIVVPVGPLDPKDRNLKLTVVRPGNLGIAARPRVAVSNMGSK